MKYKFLLLISLICPHTFANQNNITESDTPETTIIAVKTADGDPSSYAEAFGKLVGYYAKPSSGAKPVFPQRSISIGNNHYAAIAIESKITPPPGIEILVMPACHYISVKYTGGYQGIGQIVNELINKALDEKRQINQACGIQIHHLNSPDDTPIEKLTHIIYVPASSRNNN